MLIRTYKPAVNRYALPLVILLALLALLLVVVPVLAGGRPLEANLTGAEEVPVPGDPDGIGSAHITLNQGLGKVCYELSVVDIAPATAAHIHVAPVGVAGPIVIHLMAPSDGVSSDCIDVDPTLIKAIRQNPSAYYVNVHNAEFPGGAVRGQLSK